MTIVNLVLAILSGRYGGVWLAEAASHAAFRKEAHLKRGWTRRYYWQRRMTKVVSRWLYGTPKGWIKWIEEHALT